ncbi:MAG: phosphopyruvate hydratase [Lachnospiraceae bacterium]|nr:phosphopyruvate hydratase [Lachnospiraceae bacterium]
MVIEKVIGREILDSRGNPTVEAEVHLRNGIMARAMVPSGASTGIHEALELRDGDKSRYHGKGVTKAVSNINHVINELLHGMDVTNISAIDRMMCEADGTRDKSALGANAILAVSIACVKAAARAMNMKVYEFLESRSGIVLPVPMMNVINGGRHANNSLDFQEFMIMPVGAESFSEALRMGTEVYHSLKELLEEQGMSVAVGDEGGFAPDLKNADEVFEILSKAVKRCGYVVGKDFVFAMDAAASELYNRESALYKFEGEVVVRNSEAMIAYYKELCEKYPLVSIEDGLDQDDFVGWNDLTRELGDKLQLVGDDLFVTNTERLSRGIEEGCGNAILIKVNQIGTVSEAMEAIHLAHKAGYRVVVSHRSGETEDSFIADLAVATNAGQIKTGAPCRSERVAKYNQLLRIEEHLGERGRYLGMDALNKK